MLSALEELKGYKDVLEIELMELKEQSDEVKIQEEIEKAAAKIREEFAEKKEAAIKDKSLEIRAITNVMAKIESAAAGTTEISSAVVSADETVAVRTDAFFGMH